MHKLFYIIIFSIWWLLSLTIEAYALENLDKKASVENSLKDPTMPASYNSEKISSEVPNSDIIITAIFLSKDGKNSKAVIIGGHRFTVGEKVSGLEITAIDADNITLKKENGEKFKVFMPVAVVKQPIKSNENNSKENREKLD